MSDALFMFVIVLGTGGMFVPALAVLVNAMEDIRRNNR